MSLNTTTPPLTAGQRFGKWRVVQDQQFNFIQKVRCICECGTERDVNVGNLRRGHTTSCGCVAKAALAVQGTKRRKHQVNPGDKFTRLTVLDASHYGRVQCLCDCGNVTTVTANSLYRQATKSCGCLNRDNARKLGSSRHSQDRMSNHPLYNVWQRIVQAKKPMHPPWIGSAKQFILDVEAEIGPRPNGKWFKLHNPDAGYFPGNIYWGPKLLHRNQMTVLTDEDRYRIVERIKAGEKQYEIAKELQVSPSTISSIWRSRKYNP